MRPRALVVALALLGATVLGTVAQPVASAAATSGSSGSGSGATTPAPAFTQSETISRDEVVNGQQQVMDARTVTLSVSQTSDLHGRQEIAVSWSGAHPTGGVVPDDNSASAQQEEYPFVLLECRGVDSPTAPASEQLTPQTCWTQTWTERYQDSLDDAYPPYRLDEDASPADTGPIVGAPATLPATCQYDESAPVQYWVPFVAAGGQVYPGGNAGCAGEAPESDDVGGSALPSNEIFGVTAPNGTGSADFDVFTTQQNQSLGCTEGVACALVAVPIMGISCAPNASAPQSDVSACEGTGAFAPGQLLPTNGGSELTVSGSLWWSPSNWRNRITVPLTFAPAANSCSLTGAGENTIDIYGSELMIQATSQWAPALCQGSGAFEFDHVQTGEPEARNLVANGSAEAALTSDAQPGGYGKPVVNAPVALTGFAVSYAIDGANGQPYTDLKLTPRLLAKLLTESYPGDLFLKQADPAFAHNPLNITEDPEFQALNPGVAANPSASDEAASELMAISSDSDVIEALTTYINDDPTARAWLNGTPDQWGMVVNPAYKGIKLPVDQWPLLSTFEPTAWYQADENDCLYNDPVPYQPLVAAPLPTLEDVSESLQYNQPNSTTDCSQPVPGSPVGEKLVTGGRQPAGDQFLIGITPLADNARYLLDSAALETTSGTFVAPDVDSLKATAALLTPDATTGTWPIPYSSFSQPAGASAYPGTMVVYAAIPTKGLPAADAQDFAAFLKFAATTGQTQGPGVGQLPDGYLPLTSADGLGTLDAYTLTAATDVAAQNGQVPPVAPSSPPPTTTTTGPSAPPTTTTTVAQGSSAVPSVGSGDSGAFTPSPSFSGPEFSTGPATPADSRTADHSSASVARRVLEATEIPASLLLGGHLWTGTAPLTLILPLALVGLVSAPILLMRGRRRGRW